MHGAPAQTRRDNFLSQSPVVHDFAPQPGVAANLFVGLAPEEHRLTDADRQGFPAQPVRQPERNKIQHCPGKEGYQQAFPGAAKFLLRETSNEVGVFALHACHQLPQGVWLMEGVCIGKEQQFSRGLAGELRACPILAGEAAVFWSAAQDSQFWVGFRYFPENPASFVAGIVVQRQDFKVRIILG